MPHQKPQNLQKPGPKLFYGHIVVVAAFFIMAISWGAYNTFGIFFNAVLKEFGWSRAMTSGAFSITWIMSGLLRLVTGRLNDTRGPRIVVTMAGLSMGLGFLLMSRISAIWQIYIFYGLLIGVAMAGIRLPLLSTVARWFDRKRGMMTGFVSAGIGIGTLISPRVAHYFISTYDWRTAYLLIGSFVLVSIVMIGQLLKRDPSRVRQRAYIGEQAEEHRPDFGSHGFSVGEAIRTRQFWASFALYICSGFGVSSIWVHIVPHATVMGIPAANAANILAAIGGTTIVSAIILGVAADRIGTKQTTVIAFVLMAIAFLWLMKSSEAWMLYLFAALLGLSYGGISVIQSPLVAWLFGLRSHGAILAIVILGFSIGSAGGPFVAGYIFDATGSYYGAFKVCTAFAIIGVALSVSITPIKEAQPIQLAR